MDTTMFRRAVVGVAVLALSAAGLLAPTTATAASGGPDPAPASATAAAPGSFTIRGSGFGHGVGMAQYGAYQMSREGATATTILKHYYPGTGTPYATTPSTIRVQVYGPDPYGFSGYGDTAGTTKVTIAGGAWRVLDGTDTTLVSGRSGATLTVSTAADQVHVSVGGEKYAAGVARINWSGTAYYEPGGAPALATVQGAHGSYRHGQLTITAKSGIPNVTNDLRLNTDYLYGIAEMPSSWGTAGGDRALRAQAITARAYALSKMTNKEACRCHVVDDVRDQNFSGWKKESEGTSGQYGRLWTQAVDLTRSSTNVGRVLTYGGTPVAAHYFSSSGGRTADSEDVWSSVVPYERSVADPYSLRAPGNSYASWTRTLTQAQASTLFGLPTVVSVKVTSRWTSGQARTLTATNRRGTTATITGKADQVRAWVGSRTTAGSLPASWITGITGN